VTFFRFGKQIRRLIITNRSIGLLPLPRPSPNRSSIFQGQCFCITMRLYLIKTFVSSHQKKNIRVLSSVQTVFFLQCSNSFFCSYMDIVISNYLLSLLPNTYSNDFRFRSVMTLLPDCCCSQQDSSVCCFGNLGFCLDLFTNNLILRRRIRIYT
jgi:hypothetical protein